MKAKVKASPKKIVIVYRNLETGLWTEERLHPDKSNISYSESELEFINLDL